jgi:hypothetical protein
VPIIAGLFGRGIALITAWLEVRVLLGPPINKINDLARLLAAVATAIGDRFSVYKWNCGTFTDEVRANPPREPRRRPPLSHRASRDCGAILSRRSRASRTTRLRSSTWRRSTSLICSLTTSTGARAMSVSARVPFQSSRPLKPTRVGPPTLRRQSVPQKGGEGR